MKRLFALVALAGCCAISFAQVQLGKGVQVGAGGGTGGSVLAAPQNRVYIQPNSGTNTIAGPAVTGANAVAPMLQGTINAELYATGAGNNGIANALASSDCVTAGCYFQRPITSLDTENLATSLNAATNYTRGADYQYGLNHQFYKNVGQNNGNIIDARSNVFLYNDTPVNPYIKEYGTSTYYIQASPGNYTNGSPHGGHVYNDNAWFYTRAITGLRGGNIYAYKIGDSFYDYTYFFYRGGCEQANDECVKGVDLQLAEVGAPVGTVVSGGHGATTVTLNYTGGSDHVGDGYPLIDTSQILASGLLLSTTSTTGLSVNTMTTSDTHAVSTAWATLSGACGTSTSRNAPVSATCSLTGINGTFSAAAGSTVCVADPAGHEQAAVTAVGAGTITMNLSFVHASGVSIYQGGPCGGYAAPGFGSDPATWQIHGYWVAGAKTSTTFDYLIPFKGGQQGNQIIAIPGLQPLALNNLTRNANVVTASVPSGAYPYNNLVPPGSSTLVISGATPTDFNGNISAPVIDSLHNTITFNQTGPNESASSATLTLTNYNNYVMYAGAETVAPPPVTLAADNTPIIGNTLRVEPNQGNWAPGDSFIQENSVAQNDFITDYSGSGFTYPLGQPNTAHHTALAGAKWSNATYYSLSSSDSASSFQGQGGFLEPRHVMNSTDYLSNLFTFLYAPMNGSYAFNFGCPVGGCQTSSQAYALFLNSGLNGVNGGGALYFNPSNSNFFTNTPFYASSVASRTAIGVNGINGAAVVPPGTAGFGGWFEGVGDQGLSSSYETLCVGNGKIGDCSGTLGAANVYSPNVVAGVTAPTSLQVYTGGTSGSTTYTYACTAVTANGESPAISKTVTYGNATLSSSNYLIPKCYGVPGATSLNIYRTAGGATQGLIGSEPNNAENSFVDFKDTGLVASATLPPTTNTTGSETVYGPIAANSGTIAGSPICTTATGCGSTGSGTVTHTAGALTANAVVIGNAAADVKVDTGCSTDGAGTMTCLGFKTNGTTPTAVSLLAGVGNIPALSPNSAGFAAPVTGGTAYLLKMPATITAGILHAATPATGDGVNESVMTSGPVSLTADVSGLLPNANLANPSVTVNGTVCTLGSTCSPTAAAGASAFTTLTDGAPITWAAGAVALANASVTLVHTTATRAVNITGMVSGTNGVLVIKQDATGGAALTLGTGCTWYIGGSTGFVASTTLSLTTTANAINILAFTYDGTNCYGNLR